MNTVMGSFNTTVR